MIADCIGEEAKQKSVEKSKWIIRLELDKETMLDKNITMDDINFSIKHSYKDDIECVYSDYNSDSLVFRVRMQNIAQSKKKQMQKQMPLDQSDEIFKLKNFHK